MLRSKNFTPTSFQEYINTQTYTQQVWAGASISLMFFVAVILYWYCASDQSIDHMFWRIERFIASWNLPRSKLKEGFQSYDGAEAVRIGLDIDQNDPESPKETPMLSPQVWHPRRIAPLRRHIVRTTSAPVFTVPLSPSDEPKKVW